MLGIDVSKDTLACTLLDTATRQAIWEGTVPNTAHGVTRLLRRIPPESPWVLEPTGHYSTTVAQQAHAAGRQVLLASPKKAKCFLQSIQSRAKTDRLDSRGLGLYALAQRLPAYPLKSELVAHLDQLLAARKGIAGAISSLEQQLQELPHAAPPLRASIESLKAQRAALDEMVTTLTAPSISILSTPVARRTRPSRKAPKVKAATIQAELAEPREPWPAEPTIEPLYYAIARLQKVPGVGPVTAATVASRLVSRQFTHPDQFVAYCGLDIGIVRSGKRQGERGLTKQGDAELRRLLYLCAQAAVRSATKGSPFRAQYERELAKGLSKTACLCAVARKLARLCWSLVAHQESYDPQRVYQQPVHSSNNKGQPAN